MNLTVQATPTKFSVFCQVHLHAGGQSISFILNGLEAIQCSLLNIIHHRAHNNQSSLQRFLASCSHDWKRCTLTPLGLSKEATC